MSINKKDLRGFVRYDGSGRVVSGSLILRKNKPKVGKWKEIIIYECCNYTPSPSVLTADIPHGFPLVYPAIDILCNEVNVAQGFISENVVANMSDLIILLNSTPETMAFGGFVALNETTIQLTVPVDVAQTLCPNGTLTFLIFED